MVLIAWAILITMPFFAFSLAAKKQLTAGDPQGTYLRVFALQEPGAEGIGVEFARPYGANSLCEQTDVRYFMWDGEGENVTFCHCRDIEGQDLPATQGRCGRNTPPTGSLPESEGPVE